MTVEEVGAGGCRFSCHHAQWNVLCMGLFLLSINRIGGFITEPHHFWTEIRWCLYQTVRTVHIDVGDGCHGNELKYSAISSMTTDWHLLSC